MVVLALHARTPAEALTTSTRHIAREMRDWGKQSSTRRANSSSVSPAAISFPGRTQP